VSETSSIASISKKKMKKRCNKTGFPTPKKKKKIEDTKEGGQPTKKRDRSPPSKKKAKNKSPTANVKKVAKKVKLDKFITKKSPKSSSPKHSIFRPTTSDLGRRSTTLKSKNYSELESDTESLFEAKVPYRSPHINVLKQKPPVKSKKRK